MPEKVYEPKIIGFFCNWCTYAGADLAGVSRLQYPPNIRVIRVMCSGTVSPHHVLRAFQKGADGGLGRCQVGFAGDCRLRSPVLRMRPARPPAIGMFHERLRNNG